MVAALLPLAADVAKEGQDIVLSMLVVGLIIIGVILLGQLAEWVAHRRRH
jgi:hypothetical protein